MTNNTAEQVHPWEKCGLGKAPFRFIGSERMAYQACQGAPIQPGAACDYCATGIYQVYWIKSADGRRFKVGSTCVGKTNAKGSRVLSDVQKAARKIKREASAQRAKQRRADLVRYLLTADGRRALRTVDHPNPWRSHLGETVLNHVVWMLRNAGQSGTLKTIRAVNKMAGTKL